MSEGVRKWVSEFVLHMSMYGHLPITRPGEASGHISLREVTRTAITGTRTPPSSQMTTHLNSTSGIQVEVR